MSFLLLPMDLSPTFVKKLSSYSTTHSCVAEIYSNYRIFKPIIKIKL
jgi:hypothetical protein